MRRSDAWVKEPLGKRLKKLHFWNAWIVGLLALTGIVIYMPAWRGILGETRVWLKQLHIILGILSIAVVISYIPLVIRHARALQGKRGQLGNLAFVLLLLVGWILSGTVLWRLRSFPAAWGSAALFAHDLLTWVGIPYAVYHSVTRIRWVKRSGQSNAAQRVQGNRMYVKYPSRNSGQPNQLTENSAHAGDMKPRGGENHAAVADAHGSGNVANAAELGGSGNVANAAEPAGRSSAASAAELTGSGKVASSADAASHRNAKLTAWADEVQSYGQQTSVASRDRTGEMRRRISRRSAIKVTVGTIFALVLGPYFYRWFKGALDQGGLSAADFVESDGNRMLPPPSPLPESVTPAGGGAQGHFRVYTVTTIPSFHSEGWRFRLEGLVDSPAEWDWEAFLQLPRKVQVSDFHCVTGWSVYKCTWEGIPLADMLDRAGVRNPATHVKFYSGDGVYTDSLTLEQARNDDTMVAVLLDGEPIPQKLGGPVRLIVPRMYAYKSVKWLDGIELIGEDHVGFWEMRGYDKDAWVPGLRPKS